MLQCIVVVRKLHIIPLLEISLQNKFVKSSTTFFVLFQLYILTFLIIHHKLFLLFRTRPPFSSTSQRESSQFITSKFSESVTRQTFDLFSKGKSDQKPVSSFLPYGSVIWVKEKNIFISPH